MHKKPFGVRRDLAKARALDPSGQIEIPAQALVSELDAREDAIDSEADLPSDRCVFKRSAGTDKGSESLEKIKNLLGFARKVVVDRGCVAHVLLVCTSEGTSTLRACPSPRTHLPTSTGTRHEWNAALLGLCSDNHSVGGQQAHELLGTLSPLSHPQV